ncbi:Putative E3 ubiquitin-protein ligase HERC2, partial [Durusdinium trenchii]
WELLRNDAEEARRIRDQDPIEEHLIEQYVGTLRRRKDPNATHSDALAGLLKRMWQGEPEVAEFMEFVFTEFRSIPMLWRFLNISKKSLKGDDGVLTEEDFRTAMRCLFSREGRQPVEAHMSGLFDLLDTNKQNRIRLSDILHEEPHAGRGRKALLGRLRRFLEELTSSKTPEMKALMQLYKSPADAFKMSASGKVTRAGFIEGLHRLRYDEWHVDDLFTRIDRDGSGDITIEDILGFLKEAGPGGRYARPVPVHSNLLAKERTTGRLVPLNHCSIDASAKLSQLNDWFSDERMAQREVLKSARRPITSPKTTMLLSSASVPTLRKDPRRMGTTTRWQVRSQHSLSEIREPRELIYSYDPAPDL